MRQYAWVLLLLALLPQCGFSQATFYAASGTGTFTIVQVANCTISASSSSCNATVSPALAVGNLSIFSCMASNSAEIPMTQITSVSAGGTLVPAVAANTGSWGSGGTNDQQSYAYILPATATGGTNPITITLNQATNFSTACYLAELHPSANPANVALDNDSSFQPNSNCSSCANINLMLSGTNDAIFQGFMGTSANNYATAVTAPYSTNAFFSSSGMMSAGFSIAVPANGNGPTWTATSVVPVLGALAFGWNPSAFKPQSFVDFEGGTSGSAPTTATLASATHGWQGGQWFNNAVTMVYSSSASMPLLNSTGRLGDGTTYAPGLGSLGLSVTGNGVTETDDIEYSWAYNNPHANMVLTFKYNDNLPATDATDIDCGNLHGSTDFAGANCYGNGTTRFVRLETPEGNGSQINFSAPTSCPCTIIIQYNAGTGSVAGTHSVSLYNSAGSLLGTSSHAGSTAADYAVDFGIGVFNSVPVTVGKIIQWDSVQLSLNTTVPNM